MADNRSTRFMGFLGFLGFRGLRYFQTQSIADLSYFAFFAFLAYFWLNKISNEMVDERYIENSRKAKAFTMNIALVEFVVLYLSAPLHFITKELLTALCALCFASLIITYAIMFYRFEKM